MTIYSWYLFCRRLWKWNCFWTRSFQAKIAFLVGGSGMYINAVVKEVLDNLPKDLNVEDLNEDLKNGIADLQKS